MMINGTTHASDIKDLKDHRASTLPYLTGYAKNMACLNKKRLNNFHTNSILYVSLYDM